MAQYIKGISHFRHVLIHCFSMHIYGIHLDSPIIRKATLRKSGKNIEILSLEKFLSEKLSFSSLKGKIVTGLSAKDFLMKTVLIKIKGSKHIEEALQFQTSATSHFTPEEIISIPVFNKDEAQIFTIPKENLKMHLQFFEKQKIEPDIVSSVSNALGNFINWKFPKLSHALLIDLGSNEITFALLENRRIQKAYALSKGVQDLLSSLLEDRRKILLKKEIEGAAKQLDLLLLKPALNPNLSSLLNEIKMGIEKVFYSYAKGLNLPVIFTGRTDCFLHLKEFLFKASDEYQLTLEEELFAISIGLALEKTVKRPLQMLREDFFPKKNWKKMGIYSISLIFLSLFLSSSVIFFAVQSSRERKKQMLHSLNLKSDENMQQKIDEWIALIEKNSQEFPYILTAPRVTSFLNWLSNHPLLIEMKNDPIDFKQIRYELVSMPKVDSPNESFLAKVHLEFDFKSAMSARRFHEAIRNGDDLVDPDLEITWDTLDNGYRCSFYLKSQLYGKSHVF